MLEDFFFLFVSHSKPNSKNSSNVLFLQIILENSSPYLLLYIPSNNA